MSALDLRLLGRLGGAGLLAGAAGLFVLMALPHWGDPVAAGITSAVSVAAAIGGVAALRVRWASSAVRAGMVLTAGAYLALGVAGLVGGSQAAFGPLFVVVAAWCGLALGPSYTLRLSPLALICDTVPALLGRPGTALTGLGAVVVATVTGEIFARLADRVRRDAHRDSHRATVLEQLTAGQLELARATDPQQAAAIAAGVAYEIFAAGRTTVLLERDGKGVVLGQVADPDSTQCPLADDPTFEVPLIGRTGTGVRGLLTAQPRPGERLDPFGQALAGSLAAATCAALESIALNARLRTRAEIDPLTGLGNRRRLQSALARIQPGDAVIVLDLDRFKAVNDALGHEVGDQVLRAFGAHLSACCRAGEVAVRTGGEEFVIIAGTSLHGPGVAALLGRLAVDWWGQSPLTTFSAGAAIHTGGDSAATLRQADQALYEAKRSGRAAGWILDSHWPDLAAATGTRHGRLIPFPGKPFRPSPKRVDDLQVQWEQPALSAAGRREEVSEPA